MARKTVTHKWQFPSRFRRGAFGWRSRPAIQRVKEAVTEIKKVARKYPVLAAEGAVRFLQKVSPALEHVDSSSGAIGTAVNRAITELVSVIAKAPADADTRAAWLERLYDAHAEDAIPYIESLAEHWGELCASKEMASLWADRLLDVTRMALSPDKDRRGFFHGTPACLSALFTAQRYEEILELVEHDTFWHYKRWSVKALGAQGRRAEAIRYAEACRSAWASDREIDELCEDMLLSSGLADEALSTLRPHRASRGHLSRLVPRRPKEVPRQGVPRHPRRPGRAESGRGREVVRRRQGRQALRRGHRPGLASSHRPAHAHPSSA